MSRRLGNRSVLGLMLVLGLVFAPYVRAACCYFSAKEKDMQQPSQKVFITWDPVKKIETFTVQPKFEGDAGDFGMVIPTPGQPKLHEMPRDFFKELAVYTILPQRQFPQSSLMFQGGGFGGGMQAAPPRKPAVTVLETGVVGSLDYKIIKSERADDLFTWLKDNKYSYSGDEATLDFYVKKKWVFTVMKIDTMQMKRAKDGSYSGEVTPTRFQFSFNRCVYPLKITQISVTNKTEALFYVQAPTKMDLSEDMSYQLQWAPMLEAARGCSTGALPGNGDAWLKALKDELPNLRKRGDDLGFAFASGQRPTPNKQGRTPTTMEWAKRLGPADVGVLQGQVPYSETVPDPDAGFTAKDMQVPQRAAIIRKIIQQRLAAYQKARPKGFLVREAPAEDVRNLRILVGHL